MSSKTRTNSIALPPKLLQGIDLERLKNISENEDSFYEFFSSLNLDEVSKLQSQRDVIMKVNREISLESLNLKPSFEEKKSKLVESNLRATELNEIYNPLYQKLKSLTKVYDQKQLLKELKDLALESEKEADELTERFLDRNTEMELDNFVKTFMDSRTTYWKRKVKTDKMEEILKRAPVNVMPMNSTMPPYPPHSSTEQSFPPGYHYPPSNHPVHSIAPVRPAPYPPSPGTRRSLPTPSLYYQQPNHSQSLYSMPPSYPPQDTPGQQPPYPAQSGGFPPRPQGYPPQSSYRPPAVGGPQAPYGARGFSYHVPHGRKY